MIYPDILKQLEDRCKIIVEYNQRTNFVEISEAVDGYFPAAQFDRVSLGYLIETLETLKAQIK